MKKKNNIRSNFGKDPRRIPRSTFLKHSCGDSWIKKYAGNLLGIPEINLAESFNNIGNNFWKNPWKNPGMNPGKNPRRNPWRNSRRDPGRNIQGNCRRNQWRNPRILIYLNYRDFQTLAGSSLPGNPERNYGRILWRVLEGICGWIPEKITGKLWNKSIKNGKI